MKSALAIIAGLLVGVIVAAGILAAFVFVGPDPVGLRPTPSSSVAPSPSASASASPSVSPSIAPSPSPSVAPSPSASVAPLPSALVAPSASVAPSGSALTSSLTDSSASRTGFAGVSLAQPSGTQSWRP